MRSACKRPYPSFGLRKIPSSGIGYKCDIPFTGHSNQSPFVFAANSARVAALIQKASVLAGFALVVLGQAGSAVFDFETDPTLLGLQIFSTSASVWQNGGGNPGGFLELTPPVNGQTTVLIFPDLDNGAIVQAFTFAADLRVGNGTGNSGRPADGFSINYARDGDPILVADDGNPSNFAVAGQPENGTSTGLTISFDTWAGNSLPDGPDLNGIIIRVDNQTILKHPMPDLNGGCNDVNSIQTGPYDSEADLAGTGGSTDALCWQPLEVQLDADSELTVIYKGARLVDHVTTGFFPSAGRLVVAARTGVANENMDLDNVSIQTTPADSALISGVFGGPTGVTVSLNDVGGSIVDTNTIVVRLNGTRILGALNKTGAITTFVFSQLPPLPIGSTNIVEVAFQDTNGKPVIGTTRFVVGNYSVVPADYAVSAGNIDESAVGFRLRPYESDQTQPNDLVWTEQQLLGLHGDNAADLSGADAAGFSVVTNVINFDINPPHGNFTATNGYPDEPFPGLPSGGADTANNSAVEILTYLQLPAAGEYVMGINSDDGFRVTVGHNPADRLGLYPVGGSFNGGRDGESLFSLIVSRPGLYPFRLVWENGSGEGNLEWFTILHGQKTLINDSTVNGAIKAYFTAAGAPPFASSLSPQPGETAVLASIGTATVTLVDAATRVDTNSIAATFNGQPAAHSSTPSGTNQTTVSISLPMLGSGCTNTVSLSYRDNAGGSLGGSWTFVALPYLPLPPGIATAIGTGDAAKPGFLLRTYQLDQIGGVGLINDSATAEQLLAGLASANVADLSGAADQGHFDLDTTINLNYITTDPNQQAGNFTRANGYPDQPFPGIPGSGDPRYQTDNFAAELVTYVEFPIAGFYAMGVDCDDGFRLAASDRAPTNNGALVVSGTQAIAGSYFAQSAGPEVLGVSPQITVPISGKLVLAAPPDACASLTNADALKGNIALIHRGGCPFDDKLLAAKNAGAIAAVVINNRAPYTGFPGPSWITNNPDGEWPIVMTGNSSSLPAVMIPTTQGLAIEAGLDLNTIATLTPGRTPAVAEYNGSRPSADTVFGFTVPQAGVYPFRLVYDQGSDAASLEWFSVTPAGNKVLLNDTANPAALKTYRARATSPAAPSIGIVISGGSAVITFTGSLQVAASARGPYQDVTGAASPQNVELSGAAMMFWRARQ